MDIDRFLRRLTEFLRETAERRALEWRNEVAEAGWVPLPELAGPCSCCHRRSLKRITPPAPLVGSPIRFCSDCDRLDAPMVTSG
jgi:hypothetical protein